MIDFALEAERKEGKSSEEAIYEACLLRFRPIMMTTMAALLGGLPLALGSGIGSELRRPLGISMVGGLLLSQVLTLYTTPVIYIYFDRLAKKASPGGPDAAAKEPRSLCRQISHEPILSIHRAASRHHTSNRRLGPCRCGGVQRIAGGSPAPG